MVENDTVLNVPDVIKRMGIKKKNQRFLLPLLHEYDALELAESIIQKYELVERNYNHVPYMLTIISLFHN